MPVAFLSAPKRIFYTALLALVLLSCTKDKEDSYDPTGKCGTVMSWEQYTPGGVWSGSYKVRLNMDDGATYYTYTATIPGFGQRICF